VVVDFFLVPDDFLDLLTPVLRAIALLLTFHWSSNYSMPNKLTVIAPKTIAPKTDKKNQKGITHFACAFL
jgi:hypothetical protein